LIRFTVYGQASPKARARTVRLPNGGVKSYTPESTRAWEEFVRYQALEHRPARLLDGALALQVTFYLPRPRSAPKRRRYPEVKPDLDNLVKAVKDALEGLFWVNDSRIVELVARKRYGDPPRVEIEVAPAGEPGEDARGA